MNFALVDKIARALLYEGYLLYPYRPSVKNAQRWTFGGVYPREWSDAQNGTDPFFMQTECLVAGDDATRIHVQVRFLHLIDRIVGRLSQPLRDWPADGDPGFALVQSLEIGDRLFQNWQEASEEKIDPGEFDLETSLIGIAWIVRRAVESSRCDRRTD